MARCNRSLSYPKDPDLSRMLIVYIATGLAFMLFPGALVGVLTLFKISAAHASSAGDAGWIQAHGHAQIFGWLGTFILGIGYYAIPRLRLSSFSHAAAWTTYGLWTTGVATRWAVGTWPWHWRVLFPTAGVLELTAVLIFAVSVFLTRPRARQDAWRSSITMIAVASASWIVVLTINMWESFMVATRGFEPVFPASFNQRYLVLITWGFVVPFIWGFSSRWIPPLLGLGKTRPSLMNAAIVVLMFGLMLAAFGQLLEAAVLLFVATLIFVAAIRLFERPAREAKLRGVHRSTPYFMRLAYVWSAIAALLAAVAAWTPMPHGFAGASRHALTVGFFAAMVFTVGPRMLPAFFNVRRLWSPALMAGCLVLLNVGCTLRVLSQIFAYGHLSTFAWSLLPISAVTEMTAVILFAVNMLMTLTTGSPLEAFLAEQAEKQAMATASS